MSQFQVGEVAVITYSQLRDFPVGMEVTILRIAHTVGSESQYVVHEDQTYVVYASDRCLRKKRPPQDWVKLCKLDEVRPSVPKEVA